MSLINGIGALGSGLSAFGAAALKDEATRTRVPLLNATPAPAVVAPDPEPPAVTDQPTPDAAAPAVVTQPVATKGAKPELAKIAAPGGAKFTVAASAADQFAGLINDLESAGYKIDPTTSGGYNPRNIAGTNTPSQHSYGLAIDVNSARNPQGAKSESDIPPDLARALAAKYGLTWGGDWHGSTRDPMHFEVRGS